MLSHLLETLKPTQMVHLATCDHGQPRLRPMTMICKAGRFFFATGAADGKCAQLAVNPRAEFCLLFREEPYTGYLRGSGTMLRVEDPPLKKEIADFAPFIYDYWQDAADPGYALFELLPSHLGYMKPGAMTEEDIDLA